MRGSQGRKKERNRKKIIKVLTIGAGGDNQSHVLRPRRSRTNSLASQISLTDASEVLQSLRGAPAAGGPALPKKVSGGAAEHIDSGKIQPLPRPDPPQL